MPPLYLITGDGSFDPCILSHGRTKLIDGISDMPAPVLGRRDLVQGTESCYKMATGGKPQKGTDFCARAGSIFQQIACSIAFLCKYVVR